MHWDIVFWIVLDAMQNSLDAIIKFVNVQIEICQFSQLSQLEYPRTLLPDRPQISQSVQCFQLYKPVNCH